MYLLPVYSLHYSIKLVYVKWTILQWLESGKMCDLKGTGIKYVVRIVKFCFYVCITEFVEFKFKYICSILFMHASSHLDLKKNTHFKNDGQIFDCHLVVTLCFIIWHRSDLLKSSSGCYRNMCDVKARLFETVYSTLWKETERIEIIFYLIKQTKDSK